MRKIFIRYLLISGFVANLISAVLVIFVLYEGPARAAGKAWHVAEAIRSRGEPLIRRIDAYLSRRGISDFELSKASDAYRFEPKDVPLALDQGYGRVLRVGPHADFPTPSAAARMARLGDVIEIEPGEYRGDTAVWNANDVVIRGKGGIAHMNGSGVALVQDKAIWLITGSNVRVEHVAFSGAVSRDRNGAGIRAEGDRLHVVSCYFHDNESGILTNPVKNGRIIVEYSEFARNGHADGQAHQVYVGSIAEFVIRYSYIHNTNTGSAIKSRAGVNRIKYNRIVDGSGGTSNYSIDLSNGGRAVVLGNEIEQGPSSGNGSIIAFGTEGLSGDDEIFVIHNTLVNDRHDGTFLWNPGAASAYFYNNLLVGDGRALRGGALAVGNVIVRDRVPWFAGDTLGGLAGSRDNRIVNNAVLRDRGAIDYRLRPDSPAQDAGFPLENTDRLELAPDYEYLHPASSRTRQHDGRPDVGAFESKSRS